MKQPTPPWKEHRRHRSPDGLEFYSYPGPFAQRHWYYVLCLGRATMKAGYRHAPASRDGFLLHYIRKGEVEHRVRGKSHRVGPGALCWMDMSEPLVFEYRGPRRAQNWWVVFNGHDMPHLFTELRADRDPVFDGVEPARYESLFGELLRLTSARPPACEAMASAVLAAILAELFAARAQRESLVPLVGRAGVLSEPVRRGMDYMIRFHSESSLGLKRICEAAGVSLHHFVRLFRREVGLTPIQYLNRYRVEQAMRLLEESDKSMEQIARTVGVSSQNYFAYLFRKTTGTTPREYGCRTRLRA